MNKCEDCKYYRNNYGYGQCFAQKNAPRVDYNHSCENFKSKMTNEKAITVLTSLLHHWERLFESSICTKKEGEETIESLKMAIIALREKDNE